MKADFDHAAETYDEHFTHSVIGKLQRKYVYAHLAKVLESSKSLNILEINCGTGEDALWLAEKSHEVTATDISEKMIGFAKAKPSADKVDFRITDFKRLPDAFPDEKFDFIFSNFGGLNCISSTELQSFFKDAADLLKPSGQIALVIMPKNTLWEQFYFLAKGNSKSAFRRKQLMALANINGEKVATFYHNPKETVTLAAAYFNLLECKPIGFFVPPSYLETFLHDKKRLAWMLDTLESKITNLSFLSKYADHYCIVFQKR